MVNLFVVAFLYMGDTVLLVRRLNQHFGKGQYSMVGGKVEQGETARQAIKREVFEEAGLAIPESNFELLHTFHRKGTEGPIIVLCFGADVSKMASPVNKEPDKHDDMRFFPVTQLPEHILPAHKQAIERMIKEIRYSEHGW